MGGALNMEDDRYFAQDYKPEPSCTTHPIDEMEPMQKDNIYETAYRQCSKKFLYTLNQVLTFILEAKDKDTACYQVGLVTESAICDGKSMEQLATSLGCTRAALSKGARSFCKQSGLPPSSYMKKASASNAYRIARIQSIEANNKTKEK
jgi:AraC-like DNA-binding protein